MAGHGGRRWLMVVAVFGAASHGSCTDVGFVAVLVELTSRFPFGMVLFLARLRSWVPSLCVGHGL
jgi:hypothetical protein